LRRAFFAKKIRNHGRNRVHGILLSGFHFSLFSLPPSLSLSLSLSLPFFSFLFSLFSFYNITSLYAGAKYFNFLINEESCDNNNDNAGNYADIVVVNEKSSADDNVARRSVI